MKIVTTLWVVKTLHNSTEHVMLKHVLNSVQFKVAY